MARRRRRVWRGWRQRGGGGRCGRVGGTNQGGGGGRVGVLDGVEEEEGVAGMAEARRRGVCGGVGSGEEEVEDVEG